MLPLPPVPHVRNVAEPVNTFSPVSEKMTISSLPEVSAKLLTLGFSFAAAKRPSGLTVICRRRKTLACVLSLVSTVSPKPWRRAVVLFTTYGM